MIKAYYYLTKPGIIYGNAVTTIAGFFLASRGNVDWRLFLAALVGISLVIASACVFNNIFDRDIDSQMERTKNRAIVTGKISQTKAIIFGIGLLILGIMTLHLHTNATALLTAGIGFLVYVFIYTPIKKRSVHATLIGSIAGAVPPVVGYTAVLDRFDLGALLLFLILVAWQMPHFYAIAIRRLEEYKAAHIPVMSVKKGIYITKINIVVYIAIFLVAATLLTIYQFTGFVYLTIVGLTGLYWLWAGFQGFKPGIDDKAWAKKMFFMSLKVLLIFSVMISIGV